MLTVRYTGCVYLATNTENGRAYIGKTLTQLSRRRTSHHVAANSGKGSVFHAALRKYGFDAFKWQKLFESDDEQLLFAAEIMLIEDYRLTGARLYNVTPGGDGVSIPCSEARRARARETMRNRVVSLETRRKLSEATKGRMFSTEHRAKLSAAKIGKKRAPWSDERRAKQAATWAAKPAEQRTPSPETRAKMSASAKRRCVR